MWNLEKADPLKELHSVSIGPGCSFSLPLQPPFPQDCVCAPHGWMHSFGLMLHTHLLDFLPSTITFKEKVSLKVRVTCSEFSFSGSGKGLF